MSAARKRLKMFAVLFATGETDWTLLGRRGLARSGQVAVFARSRQQAKATMERVWPASKGRIDLKRIQAVEVRRWKP